MDIDLDQLKRLMRAFRRYGLTELEIQQGDAKVVLRRDFREGSTFAPGAGDEGETTFPLPVAARAPAREPAASVTPAPAVPVDEGPTRGVDDVRRRG